MAQPWHYRTQAGDAGLNTKPPRFKDLGEHSVGIFVREVLQNNLDAAIQDKRVDIDISVIEWNRSDIKSFLDFLGKSHTDLLRQAAKEADPAVAPYMHACLEFLNGKRQSALAVIVEERNCIGLLGPIRETKNVRSHFDALMRKVENNEAKRETTNTGGTWGKGSSIFTYTSYLWTWFSYSNLSQPWLDTERNVKHETRFIGRCMLAPFFDEASNTSYLGDGWFCDKTQAIDAYPFVNEEADSLARKLGLNVRKESLGTTFFVPFFNPVLQSGEEDVEIEKLEKEFIEQILQNWFISIYYGGLKVTLNVGKGQVAIDKTFLQQVPELKFKLQILDWYSNGCPPDSRFHRERIEVDVPALKASWLDSKTEFAKQKQKVRADLIIRVLSDYEDFSDNWATVNKVVLTRNKGMTISNEEAIQSTTFRAEAIFFGGLLSTSESTIEKRRHLDLFLAYAENPAHNAWCRYPQEYSQCFLERFERGRSKPEASIRYIFNEIYGFFKRLLGEEKEHSDNKDICSVFKKLARIRVRGSESGGGSLFFLRTVSEPETDSQGRYVFTKRIISNVDDCSIEVSFKPFIDSLEGERYGDFEFLGIQEFSNLELINSKGQLIASGQYASIQLTPRDELVLKVRTCPIERNPLFKNLEPGIKASAKRVENE